jgi:antitoxin PrlF
METTLEVESTLTDRYQTTVPDPVRRALRLGKRDRIQYAIRANGEVVLTRVAPVQDDPLLGQFVDARLLKRIDKLVAGVTVDLEAPLSPEDE